MTKRCRDRSISICIFKNLHNYLIWAHASYAQTTYGFLLCFSQFIKVISGEMYLYIRTIWKVSMGHTKSVHKLSFVPYKTGFINFTFTGGFLKLFQFMLCLFIVHIWSNISKGLDIQKAKRNMCHIKCNLNGALT